MEASVVDVVLPTGEFRCIVADPPWRPTMSLVNGPAAGIGAPKASPQRHYPTMDIEEIKALQVPSARQAHLYLWVLTQHTNWGHEVAAAWGFDVVTMLTWCKPGPGVGRFRCNTEHVLVCRKGNRIGNPFGQGGRHAQATDRTWFQWPRGRHSEKPDEFFTLVERLTPGPRLELFARTQRDGWSGWGNQYPAVVATLFGHLAPVEV